MRTADEEDASCFSAAQLVLAAEMADECADCAVCAAARADGCSALLRCRLPVNGAAGSSSVDSSSSSSVDVGEQVAEWTDLSANADAATRTAFWTAVGDKLCVRSVRWMATDLLTNRMCDCRSIAGGELDADGSPAATLVTDSLPSTAAAANLSALSLRNVSMGSAALPTARNLTSLTMTGCGLTDVSPLPPAPALKTLNLAGNALSSIPDAIYSQKSLQILDVRSNAIYNEQLNESQFTFLSALEAFSADSDAFQSTNCADGEVSYFASNPAIGVCNPASLAAASESASASGSASTSSSGGGSQRPAIIAGSVAITSGLLIALIAKLASQRRQRKQQIRERSTESSQDNVSAAVDIVMEDIVVDGVDDDWYALLEDDQAQTPKCALQRLNLSQWRRDATFLTFDRPMTEVFKDDGAVVEHSQSQAMWLGRYRDDQVAIRKICTDDGVRNHDLRGAALLARISHPNVLRLVGVSVSPTIGLVVLYEFMDRGDLRTYLQTTRRRQDDQNGVHTAWWGPRRAEIALDVARALMHLHSVQRVAHTRLSARTVLLDHEFSAKISDLDHFQRLPEFGEGHSRSPSVHSVDAVSPELLAHESAASEASDMFSFGMLLVELDTSRQAQVDARAVATVDSLTAEVSAECPAALRILMTACLSPDPQERPTAASVVGVLKSVVAALDEDGASRRRPKKRLS